MAAFRSTFAVWLLISGFAIAQTAADAGSQVYQSVVHSAVWLQSNRGNGMATGTGSVIDSRHALVLTNYHVVGDVDRVTAFFPEYRNGKPIAERDYYTRRARELGISGRVLARDRRHDLAIVQLERLPRGAVALPLAEKSVSPGQTVHSIGNPGGSGALWVYTPGKVRQVYMKRWRAMLENREANFEAEVVETDSPTNPGDSGGPLVNDRGELVAVTQGGAVKANSLSTFIDLSEVKKFISEVEVRRNIGVEKLTTRSTPLLSTDGGRFFSPAALESANQTAKAIFEATRKDLLIETYANVPGGKTDEVKAMKSDVRSRFMRDWARARAKSQDVHGVYMLICREPSSLHVVVTDDPRVNLHAADAKSLTDKLLPRFRIKEYDMGLDEFIKSSRTLLEK